MRPLSPKVREVLDTIDAMLTQGEAQDARDLWDVLAALRGPDTDNDELKDRTTVPIRRAAFPKMTALYEAGIRQVGAVFTPTYRSREEADTFVPEEDDSHFSYHARLAAKVLNIA